ncbi:hypothetical protein N7481_000610 [Penicillium waksmanii]|uniref:uncharacterized protein n=1 Tax=Penicillium waksmanii TaxID=69791 RepID=UPI00254988B0|nr:uncharacterized protein N7481_000610 [Penicillium waksmanii]KAJ6000201.1 hypothetical protein N7481_000610 [Penicillium waksmanii]
MDTVSTQKSPTLPKDTDHPGEVNGPDFYTKQEYPLQNEFANEENHLEESNPNSIMASETKSIERVASAQDDSDTTTEVIRRESITEFPAMRGIAPMQPISERNEPGQAIAKDAKSALSLRLDLNLDIEIELKAKIRGDLTLSLLLVLHHHYHTLGSMKLIIYRT